MARSARHALPAQALEGQHVEGEEDGDEAQVVGDVADVDDAARDRIEAGPGADGAEPFGERARQQIGQCR